MSGGEKSKRPCTAKRVEKGQNTPVGSAPALIQGGGTQKKSKTEKKNHAVKAKVSQRGRGRRRTYEGRLVPKTT